MKEMRLSQLFVPRWQKNICSVIKSLLLFSHYSVSIVRNNHADTYTLTQTNIHINIHINIHLNIHIHIHIHIHININIHIHIHIHMHIHIHKQTHMHIDTHAPQPQLNLFCFKPTI